MIINVCIHITTSLLELEDIFCQYGSVRDVKIITDRNGVSKGVDLLYCTCMQA